MEVQTFTMLNEFDVLKTCTVKVRVLKVWSVKTKRDAGKDFLIEMVLMDASKDLLIVRSSIIFSILA